MADREYHHTTKADRGLGSATKPAIVLGIVLLLGALFFAFAERSDQTASGPGTERSAPTTTGQGKRAPAPMPAPPPATK
jgi:hypothetical protein